MPLTPHLVAMGWRSKKRDPHPDPQVWGSLHGAASSASCSSSVIVVPTCYLCVGLALGTGSILPLTACTSLGTYVACVPLHNHAQGPPKCMYAQMCAPMCTHVGTLTCVHTSPCAHPHASTPTYLPLHLNSHTPLYAHAHTNMCTPAVCISHVHINACTSMNVHIHVYTSLHVQLHPRYVPS